MKSRRKREGEGSEREGGKREIEGGRVMCRWIDKQVVVAGKTYFTFRKKRV